MGNASRCRAEGAWRRWQRPLTPGRPEGQGDPVGKLNPKCRCSRGQCRRDPLPISSCGISETSNLPTLPFSFPPCPVSSLRSYLPVEKEDTFSPPTTAPAAEDCQVSPLPSGTASIWCCLPAIVGCLPHVMSFPGAWNLLDLALCPPNLSPGVFPTKPAAVCGDLHILFC